MDRYPRVRRTSNSRSYSGNITMTGVQILDDCETKIKSDVLERLIVKAILKKNRRLRQDCATVKKQPLTAGSSNNIVIMEVRR